MNIIYFLSNLRLFPVKIFELHIYESSLEFHIKDEVFVSQKWKFSLAFFHDQKYLYYVNFKNSNDFEMGIKY